MATVTVRGRGSARATPDHVTVGLSVESLRPTAAEAFADAAAQAERLVALCDELGVPAERRATSAVSLAEHGEHTSEGWQHRGYRASTRVALRLDDGALASTVLSEAVARLGTRVDGPTWSIAPDNPAHAEARRRAARDAQERAELYASELGLRVGAVVSVVEAGAAGPGPDPRPLMRVAAEAAAMPVEAGEGDVAAAVDVTFALEQE